MFGLIGKLRARPDERDNLAAILVQSTGDLPGCLAYIVSLDPADRDVIWITEVWDSEESHGASLQLPSVKAAIERAKPLIYGFESRIPIEPVGGVGINARIRHPA